MAKTYTTDWRWFDGSGTSLSYNIPSDHKNIENVQVKYEGNTAKDFNQSWNSWSTDSGDVDDVTICDSDTGMSKTLNIPDLAHGSDEFSSHTFYVAPNGGKTGTLNVIDYDVKYEWYKSDGTLFKEGTTNYRWDNGDHDYQISQEFNTHLNNGTIYAEITSINEFDMDDGQTCFENLVWQVETGAYTILGYVDDPNSSGDVSHAYSGTLKSGDVTGWLNASSDSLEPETTGSVSVSHNNNNPDGRFKLRYDYSTQVNPTPVEIKRMKINGTTYSLPLVDPTDQNLDYDGLRVYVNGQVLSADLVNYNHKDASPYRMYHPNHGLLAWRKDVS